MKLKLYLTIVTTAMFATALNAGTGVYPYVNSHYEPGGLWETHTASGVVFELHQGSFLSKHQRRWESDIISFQAKNTSAQPRCIRVKYKAFGTSLDWASSWGNNEIFYLKKGQTLKNFAGIMSYKSEFGFDGMAFQAWPAVGKNKCAEPGELKTTVINK